MKGSQLLLSTNTVPQPDKLESRKPISHHRLMRSATQNDILSLDELGMVLQGFQGGQGQASQRLRWRARFLSARSRDR